MNIAQKNYLFFFRGHVKLAGSNTCFFMFRVSPLQPSAGRHVDILNVKKFVSAQSIHFFDIISDFFSTKDGASGASTNPRVP